MAIDRYYTPQALADATGLCVSQCRALILQSPERLLVSRNPESKKKRWAISERAFYALVEKHRATDYADTQERLEKQRPPEKKRAAKKRTPDGISRLTPDGKLMNRRQLQEAGLWKGGN